MDERRWMYLTKEELREHCKAAKVAYGGGRETLAATLTRTGKVRYGVLKKKIMKTMLKKENRKQQGSKALLVHRLTSEPAGVLAVTPKSKKAQMGAAEQEGPMTVEEEL